MTVTFTDTPGSTLPSRTEAIDFSATEQVNGVQVIYDGEEAYDGTAFKAPYEESTKNGNLFSVKRTGGWPRSFTLRVEESPKGVSWGKIYEADLENVPNTDMTAAGEYEFEGATWWAKGSLWAGGGGAAAAAINGAGGGLQLKTDGVGVVRWRNQSSFSLRINYLNFSQFPDWDPALPTWLVYRTVSPNSLPSTTNRGSIGGIIGTDLSSAAITAGQKAGSVYFSHSHPWAPNNQFTGKGDVTYNVTCDGETSTAYADYQIAFVRAMQGAYMPFGKTYSATLDKPDAFFGANFTSNSHAIVNVTETATLGAYFTNEHTLADAADLDLRLNKIAIYQPQVGLGGG